MLLDQPFSTMVSSFHATLGFLLSSDEHGFRLNLASIQNLEETHSCPMPPIQLQLGHSPDVGGQWKIDFMHWWSAKVGDQYSLASSSCAGPRISLLEQSLATSVVGMSLSLVCTCICTKSKRKLSVTPTAAQSTMDKAGQGHPVGGQWNVVPLAMVVSEGGRSIFYCPLLKEPLVARR